MASADAGAVVFPGLEDEMEQVFVTISTGRSPATATPIFASSDREAALAALAAITRKLAPTDDMSTCERLTTRRRRDARRTAGSGGA